MFKKIMLISMMFILLICSNSCSILFPQYPEVRAGTFTEHATPKIIARTNDIEYIYPLYDHYFNYEAETVISKFKFDLKVVVTEISEDEHNKANGINVFKDFVTDKFYHLQVFLGTSDTPLTQIDFKYKFEDRDNIGYSYIFDRGSIYFLNRPSNATNYDGEEISVDAHIDILYDNKSTFNNHYFLDDIGYDFWYLSFEFKSFY